MASSCAICVALAVMADAGPIPNAVQAVITETADILLTPNFNKIGKIEAINKRLSPAAEGIHTNNNCPIGNTATVVM